MFERITENTKALMDAAVAAAKELGHEYIGPEHILLGMTNHPCTGNRLLSQAGCAPERAKGDVLAIVRRGAGQVAQARLPFTPRAVRVLELAKKHASEMHGGVLGTEHLLLALIDEGEGIPAHVLHACGVERASVQRLITDRDVR